MGDIVLSAGVRQNLLSLQGTAQLMATTQNRLATGKKVNSALDNPTNFFTSSALQSRAGDLNALLDSMGNGTKTLEAADNGLKSIVKTVESMQATLRQARQDKSFKTDSYTLASTRVGNISFSGGAVGTTAVNIAADSAVTNATLTGTGDLSGTPTYTGGTFTIQSSSLNGGTGVNVTIANNSTQATVISAINAALDAATGGDGSITASASGNNLLLTNTSGAEITVSGTASVLTAFGFTSGQASTNGVEAQTVDTLVSAINAHSSLLDKVRASNDNGKLRIENLSTTDLTVGGIDSSGALVGSGGTGPGNDTIGGNEVRKNLVTQFNELRTQLDKLADDSSFNGVNLLRGDKLKLNLNEIGTSIIEIQAKDTAGVPTSVNAAKLGITIATNADLDADSSIDTRLDSLATALGRLRSHSSSFGSNLSIVQNRTEFTKLMITTLQTGADTLVLADTNEEAANMLALQTRQQLSSTALSLASQADQAVLRLFG